VPAKRSGMHRMLVKSCVLGDKKITRSSAYMEARCLILWYLKDTVHINWPEKISDQFLIPIPCNGID
jgi:hypothetical protein